MCWYSENLEVKKADKDIEVFKLVMALKEDVSKEHSKLITPYYYQSEITYGYVNNDGTFKQAKEVFESEFALHFEIVLNNLYACNEAFHSYDISLLKTSFYHGSYYYVYCEDCNKYVGQYDLMPYVIIMRCVIPEGSVYAVNKDGEYVSDKLKIKSFEKIK